MLDFTLLNLICFKNVAPPALTSDVILLLDQWNTLTQENTNGAHC